jgi:hypothetical protein
MFRSRRSAYISANCIAEQHESPFWRLPLRLLLQQSDLAGFHLPADKKQHVRGRLVQIGARLRDPVNLREECGFIRRGRLRQLMHLRLRLANGFQPAKQGVAVLLEDCIHVRPLVGPKVERSGKLPIIPPAARWSKVHSGTARPHLGRMLARTSAGKTRAAHSSAGRRPTRTLRSRRCGKPYREDKTCESSRHSLLERAHHSLMVLLAVFVVSVCEVALRL